MKIKVPVPKVRKPVQNKPNSTHKDKKKYDRKRDKKDLERSHK